MKIIGSMFLIIILGAVATAQERDSLHSNDTLALSGSRNSLGSLSILPPLRLSDIGISRSFPISSVGLALLSAPTPPEKPEDVSWHMTLSRKSEDPLETLRTMLSAIEAGGVSYLAYRHISKYGFLK